MKTTPLEVQVLPDGLKEADEGPGPGPAPLRAVCRRRRGLGGIHQRQHGPLKVGRAQRAAPSVQPGGQTQDVRKALGEDVVADELQRASATEGRQLRIGDDERLLASDFHSGQQNLNARHRNGVT